MEHLVGVDVRVRRDAFQLRPRPSEQAAAVVAYTHNIDVRRGGDGDARGHVAHQRVEQSLRGQRLAGAVAERRFGLPSAGNVEHGPEELADIAAVIAQRPVGDEEGAVLARDAVGTGKLDIDDLLARQQAGLDPPQRRRRLRR